MSKREYRVVWKREGLKRKTASYATRSGAERRVALMGPEPWVAFGESPDALFCCPGTRADECSCGGRTIREQSDATRHDMPPIEYAYVEGRTVGAWERVDA